MYGREFAQANAGLLSGRLMIDQLAEQKYYHPDLIQRISEANPETEIRGETSGVNWWGAILSYLPFVLLIGLWLFFIRQMQSGGNRAFSFGKSKAKLVNADRPQVTFADVAGVEESKAELVEVVEFLKRPQSFTAIGARLLDELLENELAPLDVVDDVALVRVPPAAVARRGRQAVRDPALQLGDALGRPHHAARAHRLVRAQHDEPARAGESRVLDHVRGADHVDHHRFLGEVLHERHVLISCRVIDHIDLVFLKEYTQSITVGNITDQTFDVQIWVVVL